MKSFTCGDIVPGCKATFAAWIEETVLAGKMVRHARVADGLISIPASLVEGVRASIKNSVG